jgi:outer membrane protein OmpA-like peptidoglycan-associated protein
MLLFGLVLAVSAATTESQATSPRPCSVSFELDDVAVDDAQKAFLDPLIADFRQSSGAGLTVNGECYGCRGTALHRNEMSQRFAEKVRDYLVANGIPASAISTSWQHDQHDISSTGESTSADQAVIVCVEFSSQP